MDSARRIVTQLPLQELWSDGWKNTAKERRPAGTGEITSLLRSGLVQFVVADVGFPLQWIPPAKCYEFWKGEARDHLAEPESCAVLDEFPGCYCYFAVRWIDGDGTMPVIVLEKSH